MICESLDMRRNEFYEQVGVDPDNDYGVDISDFPNTVDLWWKFQVQIVSFNVVSECTRTWTYICVS